MNTDGHRWNWNIPRSRISVARVCIGLLLACLLLGCGTTGTGMLGGALKGWQEHELRQRPLHSNGLN